MGDSKETLYRRQPLSPALAALAALADSIETNRELCDTPLNILSSDIESAFHTPKTQKLKIEIRKKTILSQKRLSKIKSLRRRNERLIKKCVSLKELTKELRKNKFIDIGLQNNLSNITGEIFSTIKRKHGKGKRGIVKYTPAVKKFALTLNYYSPSGYKYVRRQFDSCLPHPSTLSKWYQVIDANAGFTEEAFRALRSKLSQSDKRLACLMVDEMAIRQQKTFNGKDVEGLVTFGPDDEIATQAYVLMLVSLNDAFKLPLGYFLINGMSAEQRANIIKMCLKKCHEVQAEVVSLTFDGCAANLATAKLLGCKFDDLDNLKTYFSHPATGKRVVLFLDPCHMLKLVRNTFESKKGFIDENEKSVEWRYLQELKKVQDNLGLHFANKLTEKHLNFRNNIMNVKLATQLLSESVSKALQLCSKDLKLQEFEDVSPTVNFIQIMNDLFDILNSSSLVNKGFKHPISLKDKDEFFKFLDDAKSYILALKIRVPTTAKQTVNGRKIIVCSTTVKRVVQTKVKTGFLGLVVCVQSFKHLFDDLVIERKLLRFILCYKFSQDHLELFFGVIRNHGRCNNNPNARQFKGIYRKTLQNLELSSKFTGNCIPLEDFPVLNCSSSSLRRINETTPGFRFDNTLDSQTNNDAQTTPSTENNNCDVFATMLDENCQLPETIEQIIGYLSGFIARKLNAKLNCKDCTVSLFATEKLYFHKLISLKDFGGLAYPSTTVFKICHRSECLLRNIMKVQSGKCLTSQHNITIISIKCFQYVTSFTDILNSLKKHPTNIRHNIPLVKSVIQEFVKTRMHYIARRDSLLHSSRQKLNKLTIFSGT